MPQYFNPYATMYPASYMPAMGYSGAMQNYANPAGQTNKPVCAMDWVEGEIEARGRTIPQGVSQYYLWDINQEKIYVKSLNQMGFPNPMRTIYYHFDGEQQALPGGQSSTGNYSGNAGGTVNPAEHNPTGTEINYLTKDDFEKLKEELFGEMRQLIGNNQPAQAIPFANVNNGPAGNSGNNQNGSNNGQNGSRNGNRNG